MVDQTISYNDKARSTLEGAWVEEVCNSQRLFFISKELQLNTKFHYMEVTATSDNYKISLCISKITVKQKSFFTPAYTLSKQKTTRKGKRKRGRESEKEKGRGREGKRRKRRKRKKRRKKKKKRRKWFFQAHCPFRIRSLAQFHHWA